jgi:chromosome segregation protein
MFLKSLQMQGFKSFPDKTTIHFNKGITAIVGPNGSGKSNITDAVRWVLGEMSSKMLRGTKMEDVVFDGTTGRKPMGFAEVSLTLDNSDKSLPIDFTEVTVTRRYYRSGESEYFINRSPVRLKDIHELLMDTGLGRDGYSIIGQGKISDILASKSDERRLIFEEAAGISKFRYRKLESERKLQQTEDNLVRLRDIVAELESRVGPLEKQAETAREYLRLRDEKKGLEVSLWLGNIDNIKVNKEKIEQDCITGRADLDNIEKKISDQEQESEEVYAAAQKATQAIDFLRGEIVSLNEQAAAKENEISLIRSDIEHNVELIARLDAEIGEDDEKMRGFDENIAGRRAQIDGLTADLEKERTKLSSLNDSNTAILGEESEVEERINILNNEILELSEKLTDAKIKIGFAESNCAILNQNFERLAEQLKQAEDERQAVDGQVREKEEEITQTTEKINSLNNTLSGYEMRIGALQMRVEKQEKVKQELENNINAKKLRLTTLADMQNHFDGYHDSVKRVMQASTRQQLHGICGPVSTIVRTDEKYSVAIETALGNTIQNIVVNTEQDAKAAVYYLKNNNAGRATFLPVSTISGKVIASDEMKESLGFLGIASEMVKCDDKYRNVVDWLLGRVCVVYNLENAVALAKSIGYKFRIVTLDGQVVNAGGSMTGGSAVKGSGLLTRQNEMKRLEAELKAHEEEYRGACASLDELTDKLARDNAFADGVKAEIRQHEDMNMANRLRLDDAKQRLSNAAAVVAELKQRDADAHAQYDAAKEEMLQYSQVSDTLTQEIAARTGQSDELLKGHEEIITRRDEIVAQISDCKLSIFTIEKDIETIARSIEELNVYKQERNSLIEAKSAEKAVLNQRNAELEASIEACRNGADDLRKQALDKQAHVEDIRRQREEAEKKANELRASNRDILAEKDRLIREVERLETRRETIETEYDNIVARLFDEYELTLTDAQPLRQELPSITKAQQRLGEIKGKMKRMGDVNIGAIEEYKAVKDRYDFLMTQTNDLEEAKQDMEKVIAELTEQMKSIFSEQFVVINETFKQTFQELFGGGKADLILTDPSDMLNTGIEIRVTPPGKVIKNLSALSGGEQAFVAIALYFAIIRVRPTPFCIMDEIETALDEVNTARFAAFLHTITEHTQVIIVSHRRSTMEEADVLYGVTMQEKGVSKLLTINVGQVYDELRIQ